MRAGIVSATLQIASVRICASDRPISALTAVANGAKLNQITNVRKKANQVKCKMRCRPVNDQIPATDPIPPKTKNARQACSLAWWFESSHHQPRTKHGKRSRMKTARSIPLPKFVWCQKLDMRLIQISRMTKLSQVLTSNSRDSFYMTQWLMLSEFEPLWIIKSMSAPPRTYI